MRSRPFTPCWVATVLGTMVGTLVTAAAPAQDNLDRFVYPLAKPRTAPTVTVDTSDAPEAASWAEAASGLARNWFPHICQLLATDKFTPPSEIRIVFKKSLNVPAYASGATLTINAKWVHDHPDDLGVIIHEMTHLIQAYPRSRQTPGWLVEGVADYIRWWRFEPEAPRTRIDPEKASYRDSYRTTAAFLAWITQRYDKRLVPRIDAAMRERRDPVPVFLELTGKSVDDLWTEFVAKLPGR
jgi:hypothetical protein